MPGIGVLANVAVVALGGILGLGCGRLITERFQNTIMRACALAVLFLGLGGALREMFQIGADGRLALVGVNMMLASLIGGAVIGELLNIEDRMTAFGAWLKCVSGSGGDAFHRRVRHRLPDNLRRRNVRHRCGERPTAR